LTLTRLGKLLVNSYQPSAAVEVMTQGLKLNPDAGPLVLERGMIRLRNEIVLEALSQRCNCRLLEAATTLRKTSNTTSNTISMNTFLTMSSGRLVHDESTKASNAFSYKLLAH
jgi:hypothetical protein